MSRLEGRNKVETIKRTGETENETEGEIREQAAESKDELSSIKVIDEADQGCIDGVNHGLRESYTAYTSEKLDPLVETAETTGNEVNETMGAEKEGVEDGIGHLEAINGISEVGRDAVQGGIQHLENSSQEYGEIMEESNTEVQEIMNKVETARFEIPDIF